MSKKARCNNFSVTILTDDTDVSVKINGVPTIPLLSGKDVPIASVIFNDPNGIIIQTTDGTYHQFCK